jgi:PhoH-like ATPase
MTDKSTKRKIFVVDTSVLLYDKNSIHSFPGNDVIIPLIVLDELDRFKDKPGLIGENARHINRFLDGLRNEQGDLSKGVELSDNQTLRVDIEPVDDVPAGLDIKSADNRIIGQAVKLSKENPDQSVIVVTKDINFRVKCDALGIYAEDYYKDTVKKESLPDEIQEVSVPDSVIDSLHKNKKVKLGSVSEKIAVFPNQPLILRGETSANKSALGIASGNQIYKPNVTMNPVVKIEPRNKEQSFALHMMLDPSITLVTLTGIAGSGKTFLSLMAGLSGVYEKNYKRIVITRPIQPVGRDLGYLPGDLNDKMSVWIKPIVDNFREGMTEDATYFDMMQSRGEIEIAPLPYIRGRTFNDSFLIVDEAQNATIHELKTIITRVGQNSKIILLGDIDQVDTPYLDTCSNGLSITVNKFRDQDIAGHIRLPKGERSDLATIASHIL